MTARVSFQDRLRRLGLALAGVTVFALVGWRSPRPGPWR